MNLGTPLIHQIACNHINFIQKASVAFVGMVKLQ